MEPSRLLHIARADYEAGLKREAEMLAAAVRAAACEHAEAAQREQILGASGFSADIPCAPRRAAPC
jgi:hypothetical protein